MLASAIVQLPFAMRVYILEQEAGTYCGARILEGEQKGMQQEGIDLPRSFSTGVPLACLHLR